MEFGCVWMSLLRDCMILGVFIEFFGVKIVITDIYRYLPIFYQYLSIFYRYLPIFYLYFFINSSTCAREIKSRNFSEISRISDISPIF